MPLIQRLPEPHIDYAYGIFLLQEKHKLIRTLKKRYQPSVHGTRTWGSAFLLMDYLSTHPLLQSDKVLELGCGWGAASVFCAHRFQAEVTGLDIDPEVFPFLDVYAEINSVQIKKRCVDATRLRGPDLGRYNVLLGGDICFWQNLVKPMTLLINRAINNGTERVIIADPGRPTFYELCDALSQKHQVSLQEWYSIEPDRFAGEVVEIVPRA